MKHVDVSVHGYLVEPWELALLNRMREHAYKMFEKEPDKMDAIKQLYKDYGIPIVAGLAMWENYQQHLWAENE